MAEVAVEKKKIVLSGIQPSGNQFTLGNYIGAIRNWANMQEEFNCVYMVQTAIPLPYVRSRQNSARILIVLLPVCWQQALILKRVFCLFRPMFLPIPSWLGF